MQLTWLLVYCKLYHLLMFWCTQLNIHFIWKCWFSLSLNLYSWWCGNATFNYIIDHKSLTIILAFLRNSSRLCPFSVIIKFWHNKTYFIQGSVYIQFLFHLPLHIRCSTFAVNLENFSIFVLFFVLFSVFTSLYGHVVSCAVSRVGGLFICYAW